MVDVAEDRGFLEWFETTWHDAEMALHNGDAGPRDRVTWSTREPVTLFGAWRNATNADEARAVFRALAASFSDVVDGGISVVAYGVSGDLAYTAHREHTTTTVDGKPERYTLRVTQVYRHEDGTWKVIHRHGDREAEPTASMPTT
jgi:ketosteroid isomerase-like protein